jgi:hypothetical protein
MSIISVSLLRCYSFGISDIYDKHQALQTVKCISIRYWTACRNGSIAVSLVTYKFLHRIGCMCVALGENWLFRIFDHWYSVQYYTIRVCVVSIDGFVLSCLFLVICAFRHSVVDSLVMFLFVVLNWYDFLPIRVLFMVLFPGFMLRCNFVAPNGVALLSVFLGTDIRMTIK